MVRRTTQDGMTPDPAIASGGGFCRSEAIPTGKGGDCFVANAPRSDNSGVIRGPAFGDWRSSQ